MAVNTHTVTSVGLMNLPRLHGEHCAQLATNGAADQPSHSGGPIDGTTERENTKSPEIAGGTEAFGVRNGGKMP